MAVQITQIYGREQQNNQFSLLPDDDQVTVKTIDVWCGKGSGDAEGKLVLKGIQLTWHNGKTKKVYKHDVNGDEHFKYNFKENEVGTWNIRAAWRVDQISFESSKDMFEAGGNGGTEYKAVANGVLIGIEGEAGWEIDCIRLKYRTE